VYRCVYCVFCVDWCVCCGCSVCVCTLFGALAVSAGGGSAMQCSADDTNNRAVPLPGRGVWWRCIGGGMSVLGALFRGAPPLPPTSNCLEWDVTPSELPGPSTGGHTPLTRGPHQATVTWRRCAAACRGRAVWRVGAAELLSVPVHGCSTSLFDILTSLSVVTVFSIGGMGSHFRVSIRRQELWELGVSDRSWHVSLHGAS
jgi:hypothetical protein